MVSKSDQDGYLDLVVELAGVLTRESNLALAAAMGWVWEAREKDQAWEPHSDEDGKVS